MVPATLAAEKETTSSRLKKRLGDDHLLGRLSVLAGKSSEELAENIAKELGARLVKTQNVAFPDGEGKITLDGTLTGKKIIVVQSVSPPADTNLVRALSLVAKAKESAPYVIAVIPYLGYARQDREFLPGEIVTLKVLSKLFQGAGASEIIIVDIHSKMGLEHFEIKSQNVTAVQELANHFKGIRLKDPLAVSPDQGGRERAEEFAGIMGVDCIALTKYRNRKTGAVQIKTKDIVVSGRDIIIVDDMISTGGSIIKATKFLKRHKCRRVFVACTHGVLVNDAEEKIKKAGVTKIVSTNTVPGRTSSVDVSAVIAKAIR